MANVEHDDVNNEICDTNLRDELRSRQQFLVDSEIERARHKVFNYTVENPVSEKLDHFFNIFNCAAMINLTSGFILKKNRIWRIQIS